MDFIFIHHAILSKLIKITEFVVLKILLKFSLLITLFSFAIIPILIFYRYKLLDSIKSYLQIIYLNYFVNLAELPRSQLCYILLLSLAFKSNDLYALNLHESISQALKNNTDIRIQEDKLRNLKLTQKLVLAEFLPKISANLQSGRRYAKSSSSDIGDYGNYLTQELNIEQNIFSGLSSIIMMNKSNKEYLIEYFKLQEQKQSLAYEVARVYANILWQEKILQHYAIMQQIFQQIALIADIQLRSKVTNRIRVIEYKNDLLNLLQKIGEEQLNLAQNRQDFQLLSSIVPQNLEHIATSNLVASKVQSIEKINNNFILQAKYLEYQLTLDDINYKASEFSPKLSLIAGVSKQKNNLFLRNQDITDKSLGINLSIPIFQRGAEYINLQYAKNIRDSALDNYQLYRDNITAQIAKHCDDFIMLSQNIQHCEEVLINLREQENIAQLKLKVKNIDLIGLYRTQLDIENQHIKCLKLHNMLANSYFKITAIIGGFDV